jgi:hypothetical protein
MCEHCLKNISLASGMSVDKFSRWLGFVQGVMIMRKFTTVKEERDWTRPWLREPQSVSISDLGASGASGLDDLTS